MDICELLDKIDDSEKLNLMNSNGNGSGNGNGGEQINEHTDEQQNSESINSNSTDEIVNEHTDSSINEKEDTRPTAGFYLMLNYIKANKADVPVELRNTCMHDEYDFTLAMHWIYEMKDVINKMIGCGKINETVPLWMRHRPDLRDRNGWTIAMHWVMMFKCDVPTWMRHDPTIQNSRFHKTVAMIYLSLFIGNKAKNFIMPEWMQHTLKLFDNEGNTVASYWLGCTEDDLPEWILRESENGDFVNENGETLAMEWIIHRKSAPPLNLMCNPKLKTKYGMTVGDLYYSVIDRFKDESTMPQWMKTDEETKE